MSRRPLYIALCCALLLSCLIGLAAHEVTHPQWLRALLTLASFPGMFVAIMLFGMCNADNVQGWTVTIGVNAVLYAIPLLPLATIYELHHRARSQASIEAN